MDADPAGSPIQQQLAIPLEQAHFRKTMQPVYNMLTHAVEFRTENENLLYRHEAMREKLDGLFRQAQSKLTRDEYDLFMLAYEQCRNFSMYKDVMGAIDPELLPFWFGLIGKVRDLLFTGDESQKKRLFGHCGMFYFLVWYLPDRLKGKVMSVDPTPFSIDTL